ncbi:hypothetical protein J1N35_040635 [Gossypium stocksii]|uniref:Uncharacterized protein n=1 Tax=Gossypium stocksii TaxID=47602 RepID=A0A9D3ZII5_9ROSI|nr:hypothetical protein J1N35_040635 [Gossypium stocksii]
MNKLIVRDDALEIMVMALKEETIATMGALSTKIKEFEGKLAVCQATLGKGVLGTTLNHEINVLKPNNFKGTRFIREVGNFLWEMEQYFCAMGIKDDDAKVNIVS